MHASNFHLAVVGNNDDQLDAAIAIALDEQKVRSWQVHGKWFCCYWSNEIDNVHALPFDEGVDSVRHTVKTWLKENEPTKDEYPDIDGSVHAEGWELRSGWTAVQEVSSEGQEIFYEVLRIRQRWAEYHK